MGPRPRGIGTPAVYRRGSFIADLHAAIRIWRSARIYGWRFASLVPIRIVFGNLINCAVTARALWTYTQPKFTDRPLRWAKTEHAYPSRAALLDDAAASAIS